MPEIVKAHLSAGGRAIWVIIDKDSKIRLTGFKRFFDFLVDNKGTGFEAMMASTLGLYVFYPRNL